MTEKDLAKMVLELSDMICKEPELVWAENVEASAKVGFEYADIAKEIEKLKNA